jgi:hypothetical protein
MFPVGWISCSRALFGKKDIKNKSVKLTPTVRTPSTGAILRTKSTMEKDNTKQENYIKNEELKKILADFTASVLLHKPSDIYSFAKDYFSTLHATPPIQKSDKPLPIVITGPSGVGKGTRRILEHFIVITISSY